jgi:hypothetical protein
MGASTLDLRIVRLGIEVNGQIKTYDNLAIKANGTKYANANQNEADITIYNVDRATQDYILTQTSPFNLNRTPKIVRLEAGRVSYGASLIYSGNIVSSKPSQPPDIGVTLKCLTGNFFNGQMVNFSMPGVTTLSNISQQIAASLNNTLLFQTTDRNVANYAYAGSALKQIEHLSSVGNINAFADNSLLIIKTIGLPLSNTTRVLNLDTGMIGIPEITERGLKVKFLLDNKTTLGGGLQVTSKIYPAANGNYVIYKLGFDLANRDTPFYFIAEAIKQR